MHRLLLALVVVACLAISLSPKEIATSAPPPDTVPGRYLVGFTSRPDAEAEAAVRRAGGRVTMTFDSVDALAVDLPDDAAHALLRNPRVAYVEPDYVRRATDLELDNSWGTALVGAGLVHGSFDGTGVRVGVVDTGVNCSHPDLDCDLGAGRDFVVDANGAAIAEDSDAYGHGTHVAGIVGALDNGIGGIGVAPSATIVPIRVCDENGSCPTSLIIRGVDYARAQGIAVVNMSLGSRFASTAERNAMDAAAAAGVVLVAAAGNAGTCSGKNNTVEYPGGYDSVIAVAAVGSNLQRPCFSSTGPQVELSAPGVAVFSTWTDGGYHDGSGTSMAAPHVAGTVALLRQQDGSRSVAEIRAILAASAQDLGSVGRDTHFGHGFVRADVAVLGTPAPAYGSITGRVSDASTGAGIAGATVTTDTGDSTTTTADGTFQLSDVPTGQRTVTASASGYKSSSEQVSVIEGTNATVEFALGAAKGKKPR